MGDRLVRHDDPRAGLAGGPVQAQGGGRRVGLLGEHGGGAGGDGRSRPPRGVVSSERLQQRLPAGRQVARHLRPAVQAGEGGLDDGAVVLPAPGEALQQHQPQRVHVGRGRDALAGDLLRSEVAGGADREAAARHAGGVDQPGDAEVGEAGPAVAGQQHVGGLDVAVHHPVVVHVGQGGGEVGTDPRGRLLRHGAPRDPVGEGRRVDQRHHDEGPAAVLADVEQLDEAGVAQALQGADLALAHLALLPGDHRVAEELHRDQGAGLLVGGGVDVGHPAAPQQSPEAVAPSQQRQGQHVAVDHELLGRPGGT